jgi:hypothetical protein
LPPDHHFSRLVVLAEHTKLLHAGPQLLIASLQEKYWITRIRNAVKTVIHHCLTCYNSSHKQHNSSRVSYHHLESNPRGHFSPQA